MVLHKVLFFFYFLIMFVFSSELIIDLFSAQSSSSLSVNLNHGVISVEVYGVFFLVLYTGAMSDSSVLPHHNRVYSFIAVCTRTCV